MELNKREKNNNQETDGYGRDKRPKIGKLKKEITITETRRNRNQRKTVKQSGYPWNQSEE